MEPAPLSPLAAPWCHTSYPARQLWGAGREQRSRPGLCGQVGVGVGRGVAPGPGGPAGRVCCWAADGRPLPSVAAGVCLLEEGVWAPAGTTLREAVPVPLPNLCRDGPGVPCHSCLHGAGCSPSRAPGPPPACLQWVCGSRGCGPAAPCKVWGPCCWKENKSPSPGRGRPGTKSSLLGHSSLSIVRAPVGLAAGAAALARGNVGFSPAEASLGPGSAGCAGEVGRGPADWTPAAGRSPPVLCGFGLLCPVL